MSNPINPFMGFHTNFDPDSGSLTEPGWANKEIMLLRVVDDLDEALKSSVKVHADSQCTEVVIDGTACHVMEGNVFEGNDDIQLNEVIIEVDLDGLTHLSKSFFAKNIGSFDMSESPIGGWFDPEKRNKVLTDRAFDVMLENGSYNHLVALIYMPFTKDVFQRGELTGDSPDLFTRVSKRKLKTA